MTNNCEYIFVKGCRKGEKCNKRCKEGKKYCSTHSKYKNIINNELSITTSIKIDSDEFTFDKLIILLNGYTEYVKVLHKINSSLGNRKIRNPNFPSEISENIVKFSLKKKGLDPIWNVNTGDLSLNGKKLEVKGLSSDGPSSFGPKEKWEILYFVDCKDYMNKHFKIYEISLANNSEIFRNVKLNKTETFGEIANANKRGKLRGCFYTIFKPQLESHCTLIFDDNINVLNDANKLFSII